MMLRSSRRAVSCCVIVALVSVTWLGCSKPRIATYPVAGGVKFDTGEAVSFGMVEFRPLAGGPVAHGKLDQFGRFTLRTFAVDDGAVAGRHQVVVVQHLPPQTTSSGHTDHESALIAPEFAAYDTSPLTAEIDPDGENEVDLIVRRLSRNRSPAAD